MRPVNLDRLALDRPVVRPVALYVLLYVAAFKNSHGYPPTSRDIMRECGWRSPNRAREVLNSLFAKKLLTHQPMTPRSLVPTVRFIPADQLGAEHE